LARNFALAKAAELGAAWALTVDTDERLSFPGFATPEQLRAALDADAAVLAWRSLGQSCGGEAVK
jgi:hypothetical protein